MAAWSTCAASPQLPQRTSSRTRSDRSMAHPIAQVKHPVALNHHVSILQQVLRVDRPEVALAGPEHDGYDVHAHLVNQARGKHLATAVASGDRDHAATRELLRLRPGCPRAAPPAGGPWPPGGPGAAGPLRSPPSSCALARAASTPSTK